MFNLALAKINLFLVYNKTCIYNLWLVKATPNLEVIFSMSYLYLSKYLGHSKETTCTKVGSIHFAWHKELILIWLHGLNIYVFTMILKLLLIFLAIYIFEVLLEVWSRLMSYWHCSNCLNPSKGSTWIPFHHLNMIYLLLVSRI